MNLEEKELRRRLGAKFIELVFRVIGSLCDIIFLGYILFHAFKYWNTTGFDTALPYLMLYAVWCCSSALQDIKRKLGDQNER